MKGRVILYHGEGEGKTSASLGHVVREAGHGKKVAIIQFMKGREDTGEYRFLSQIENVNIHLMGAEGFLRDGENREPHMKKAQEGLALAKAILTDSDTSLLVLDEILYAVMFGLVEEKDLVDIVEKRGDTNIILTGREPGQGIIHLADIVTHFKKEKHHYDLDHKTDKGLDW